MILGKFLGLAEYGTAVPGHPIISTGLDHILELGITHIQLLPIQHFDREKGAYNWGYMPLQYFSPEGWYASSEKGDARVRELKQLVHTLHQKGIGVVMDVVYNHFDKVFPFAMSCPH